MRSHRFIKSPGILPRLNEQQGPSRVSRVGKKGDGEEAGQVWNKKRRFQAKEHEEKKFRKPAWRRATGRTGCETETTAIAADTADFDCIYSLMEQGGLWLFE